ncbi:PREDICTED: pentatricopeptide repeat-containing protein At3g62470, mitochondrial-like [Populus euphratica]|uniref:Pentatricopeptide repeat-containing protein At3g62470, mitochondrial-like n=1 Tax=Populus euphratica TaxID=75702 RepID=A0AAJ6V939_POPEU|nr:PREDICTED: pentatricopeptide repeat-containing protein At3g62470, mitochondrial-like [Populus euphratica]
MGKSNGSDALRRSYLQWIKDKEDEEKWETSGGEQNLSFAHKYRVGVETINALLDGLGRAKLGKEAQALFVKLEGRFTPNLTTYTVLLSGWCRVKNLMEAGRIWNEMLGEGFKPDIVTHNIMLEGLLMSKKRSGAIKFFEVMKATAAMAGF